MDKEKASEVECALFSSHNRQPGLSLIVAPNPNRFQGEDTPPTESEEGRKGALLTSLVNKGQNGGCIQNGSPERCPRVRHEWVNEATGEIRPGTCSAYLCELCGRRKARNAQHLAGASQPERMLTLTKIPEDFQQARDQVRDYTRRLRLKGYRVQTWWTIEANPKGTGLHLHALQHGDYVPQKELQEMWGGRRVDIRSVASELVAARYVIKGATDASTYVGKGAVERGEKYAAHIARNNGRAAHWSRGYHRDNNGTEMSAQTLKAAMATREIDGTDLWVMRLRDDAGLQQYRETKRNENGEKVPRKIGADSVYEEQSE